MAKEVLQWSKVGDELRAFYDEIVIENGPRYRDIRQVPHLFIDFWVSLFACFYTLGHLVGLALYPTIWYVFGWPGLFIAFAITFIVYMVLLIAGAILGRK